MNRGIEDNSVQRPDRDQTIPRQLRIRAVGEVTPGIVHDANNALAVLVWNLERSTRSLAAGSKEAASATTAMDSAMKAASLLRRVLEYAGHGAYDASLVNLEEMLSRLFATAVASVAGDIAVERAPHGGVGPVIVDETLLELALLDLIAVLSRTMARNGSIVLTAANLAPDQAPPPEAPAASILLSLTCKGIAPDRLPPLRDTLLEHFAAQAGGSLTVSALPKDRCEIRLYLPRAIANSGNANTFT
jgi:hypothetical protein